MVPCYIETQMRIIARRTLREFVESLAGQKDQPAVKAAFRSPIQSCYRTVPGFEKLCA